MNVSSSSPPSARLRTTPGQRRRHFRLKAAEPPWAAARLFGVDDPVEVRTELMKTWETLPMSRSRSPFPSARNRRTRSPPAMRPTMGTGAPERRASLLRAGWVGDTTSCECSAHLPRDGPRPRRLDLRSRARRRVAPALTHPRPPRARELGPGDVSRASHGASYTSAGDLGGLLAATFPAPAAPSHRTGAATRPRRPRMRVSGTIFSPIALGMRVCRSPPAHVGLAGAAVRATGGARDLRPEVLSRWGRESMRPLDPLPGPA
jgi:hypothetical protein